MVPRWCTSAFTHLQPFYFVPISNLHCTFRVVLERDMFRLPRTQCSNVHIENQVTRIRMISFNNLLIINLQSAFKKLNLRKTQDFVVQKSTCTYSLQDLSDISGEIVTNIDKKSQGSSGKTHYMVTICIHFQTSQLLDELLFILHWTHSETA